MGTTTLDLLTQEMSEDIGDYRTGTTTGAGNGGGTTIVDTSLQGLTEDDGGIQAYGKIRSGAADGGVRRNLVGDAGYTASSGTFTVNQAYSAQIASGVTWELHRFDPALKQVAIRRAIQALYPMLYLELWDESLVVDNLLSNGGFETAASGNVHPSWTKVGTPTIDDNATIRRHLTNSAKIVASGAAEGEEQVVSAVNIHELLGKTVHAQFHVYATTADWARIRIDFDGGTTFESSDYHTGANEWQLLTIAATIPEAATQLSLRLEVADGGTGYFDAGWMAVGNINRMALPTSFRDGPHMVLEQADLTNPEGDYLPIMGAPGQGRIIRLRGMGYLSQPTTETGTVEVDGSQAELIRAKALEILFRGMVVGDRNDPRHTAEHWRAEVNRLLRQRGVAMRGLSAQPPNDAFEILDDSGTQYINWKNRG